MLNLNKNFTDFLSLLENEGVKYLLIGGYAVGYHGHPRYTRDMDIFVAISPENAERLVQVINKFGFSDAGVTAADFLDKETIIELGREPLGLHISSDIDGASFDECYKRRVYFSEGNLKIPTIGFEDLIRNKQASARPKDLQDIDALKEVKAKEDGKK